MHFYNYPNLPSHPIREKDIRKNGGITDKSITKRKPIRKNGGITDASIKKRGSIRKNGEITDRET